MVAAVQSQDLDDDWTEGVTAAAQATRDDILLSTGRISSGPFDASRVATMRQLRMLVSGWTLGVGSKVFVQRDMQAHGRGVLLSRRRAA